MTSRVPSKRTLHTEDDHIFVGDDDYFVDDDQIFVDDDHFFHVTLLSADYHGDMKSQMPQSNCTSHTYVYHIFCSRAA